MRKLLKIGMIVVVILVVVVFYSLKPRAIPAETNLDLDLGRVRELAYAVRDQLPLRLNSLQVAVNQTPANVVIAGAGWHMHTLPTYTYQLVYQDKTLIIDAVTDHQTAVDLFPDARVFEDAYQQMQQAMRRADGILVTHEHFDHCTGISRSPYLAEIAGKVLMTTEQLRSREMETSKFTPEILARLEPLEYDRYHSPFPGLVLIKAAGHTPGSQMVFIALADGRELLLVGDIAWHMDNITSPVGHPRLVHWMGREDGKAMAHQLRWLNDLGRQSPEIHIVVAHDGDQMDAYRRKNLIGDGLE